MKIYFTCSTSEFEKHYTEYSLIRQAIINQGHILTRDWIPETKEKIEKGIDVRVKDYKEIYKSCVYALETSDVVIVEDTVSNFSTGHQITLALQSRKPTLVVWSLEKRHQHFNSMFISGIESEFLETQYYKLEDIDKIISKFIYKSQKLKDEERFNLKLNKFERIYLDWSKEKYGNSRTNTIRKAINKLITEDEEYQNYLG